MSDIEGTERTADAIENALARHREHVDRILETGDEKAIKGLYVELGDLLEQAIGEDLASAPVLSLPETAPVVLSLLAGVRGRLLDAGCGPNPALSIALGRDPDRTLVAMDIGFGIVKVARAVAEASGIRVHAVVADLEALPFRDRVFEGGVCDDTIEHLPHDDVGVAELSRVLRPGGRMVIATPNRRSAEVLARKTRTVLRGRLPSAPDYYAATSHLREYTWPEAERLLKPVFYVRRRASVGWQAGGWKRRVATRLTARPLLRRLARMIVVEVEPRIPDVQGRR